MNKNDLVFIYDAIRAALEDRAMGDILSDDAEELLMDSEEILEKELEKLGETSAGTTHITYES